MFVASQSEPAQKMVVVCIMSILFVVQGMTLFNPLFLAHMLNNPHGCSSPRVIQPEFTVTAL